jgi:hypothetical protein
MSPGDLNFFRVYLLEVRPLTPVLFPAVDERAIIFGKFLRYYDLQ